MRSVNLFLSLIILSILTISCGDDNETTGLIGEWQATSFEATAITEIDFFGISSTTTSNLQGENINYSIEFKETTYNTQGSYTITGTSNQDGYMVELEDQEYNNVSSDGDYTSSESTIIIYDVLFQFDEDPVIPAGENEMQYVIDGDNLTITDEVIQNEAGTKITVNTKSTWTRK